jgi:SAM-dependent methyltransferase
MSGHGGDDEAGAIRRVENGRLVYYQRAADARFWDEQWQSLASDGLYAEAARGGLGWFEKGFTRYLPKTGRILEAGCGLGQYVLALRQRGYDAEGVDWAQETISAIRTRFPDLPVRVGDATAIDVPDGSYRGYVSLGVIEHRREGPEPFLAEAFRVLAPGGMGIITVPCFNGLRRLKASLGCYRGARPDDRGFYQYAFSDAEYQRLLAQAGFELVDRWGYDSYKSISGEIPLLRTLSRRRLGRYDVGALVQRALAGSRMIENSCGHMQLAVVRKPVDG